MTHTTDNELVKQAQAGDYQAFELLASRHARVLYATAWHLTHNHHNAQDVAQNTVLSALEHLLSFRQDSSFSTWVTRIAINFALKLLRSRRQHPAVALDAPDEDGRAVPVPQYIADWRNDPAQTVQRRELRAILDDAVSQLSEGQRLVFVLRDVQGLSVGETAQVFNLTETTSPGGSGIVPGPGSPHRGRHRGSSRAEKVSVLRVSACLGVAARNRTTPGVSQVRQQQHPPSG